MNCTLEQNPETASRWAQLARQGKKVMQFLHRGRYIAVVVDGKVGSMANQSSRKWSKTVARKHAARTKPEKVADGGAALTGWPAISQFLGQPARSRSDGPRRECRCDVRADT
jgi:hypothetical protein